MLDSLFLLVLRDILWYNKLVIYFYLYRGLEMKKNSKLMLIVLVPLIIFLGYIGYDKVLSDNTAPIITVDDEVLTVSVYDDEDVFLKGVRAEDNKDGDLTSSVVIESKTPLSADGHRVITYAVIDKKGNVGRAERKVSYTDYESVTFELCAPLRFPINVDYNLLKDIEAYSNIDGDLTSKIKCSTGFAFDYTQEGVHELEFSVTDSVGVTNYLPTIAEFYDPEKEIYSIELSDYLLYLEVGDDFNPFDYYLGSDSGLSPNVESDVNTDEPGVYNVRYTVGTEDACGSSFLVVVVTE